MSYSALGQKVTLAVSLLLVAIAPTALAKPPSRNVVVESITVRYGDLNLENALGAEALVKRIAHAARKVCGTAYYVGVSQPAKRRIMTCRSTAIQNAIATVDRPLVTAAYDKKYTPSSTVAGR